MQALLLLNDQWPIARAKKLANRLQRAAPGSLAGQIEQAYWICFGRAASQEEVQAALEFVQHQQSIIDGHLVDDDADTNGKAPASLSVANFPNTNSPAAVLKPSSKQKRLVIPFDASLPAGDFSVEAYVQLHSLYADATVRTIAAHWNSNTSDPGWALGVTSKKSKYTPRNLILQLVGRTGSGQLKYEVIPSNIHLELNQPYYVAVSVDVSDTSDEGVTFFVQKLLGDQPLQTATAKHEVSRAFRPDYALNLGGRHGSTRHYWDGLIDNVRLSGTALTKDELLVSAESSSDVPVIGDWQFDGKDQASLSDQSPHGNDISLALTQATVSQTASTTTTNALVDFCHVLLNSNEFLYVD